MPAAWTKRDGAVSRRNHDAPSQALDMAAKGGQEDLATAREPARRSSPGPKPRRNVRPCTAFCLLNDDYTPMDFVIGVLCSFFHKDFDDANRIMWQVHNNGVGECGVYTYEVADTKVTQVMDHARKHQHPLQCVMEKK